MKFAVIILSFCAGAILALDNSEFQELKRGQIECEKLLGEPKNFVEKMVTNQDLGDKEKAGKMALCIIHSLGYMTDDGEIITEKFKLHVDKLTEDENVRKSIMDHCVHKNGNTPEEAALNFGLCMHKQLPNVQPTQFQLNN